VVEDPDGVVGAAGLGERVEEPAREVGLGEERAKGWWTHPSSHASEEVGVQLEERFDGGDAENAEDINPGGRRRRGPANFFRAGWLFDEMHWACETSPTAIS
jgi:hypothetical protein